LEAALIEAALTEVFKKTEAAFNLEYLCIYVHVHPGNQKFIANNFFSSNIQVYEVRQVLWGGGWSKIDHRKYTSGYQFLKWFCHDTLLDVPFSINHLVWLAVVHLQDSYKVVWIARFNSFRPGKTGTEVGAVKNKAGKLITKTLPLLLSSG
jgi:hypothetical protein